MTSLFSGPSSAPCRYPSPARALNPAVEMSWHWWLLVAGLVLLAGLLVATWVVLSRHPRYEDHIRDDVATVATACLTSLDRLEAMAEEGADRRAVCRRTSQLVRRFIGLAASTDADFMTADQLHRASRKDPNLRPAADFAMKARDLAFGADPTLADTRQLLDDGREVVKAWR